MSGYKRFISYVYEYPDYQKGSNRGFMKVECRNGFCQMSFSLNGLCRDADGSIRIYGFRRNGAQLQGSLLARREIQNGTLRLPLKFPEEEIGEQNFPMEELSGAILLDDNGMLYATQWDDGPLNLRIFSENIPDDSPKHEPEASSAQIPEIAETLEPAASPEYEPEAPSAQIPETAENLEPTVSPECGPEDTSEFEPESTEDIPVSEPESAEDIPVSEPVIPEDTPASEPVIPEDIPASEPEIPEDTPASKPESTEDISASEPESMEECSPSEDPDVQTASMKDSWQIQPPYFRDGCIVNCVRITSQDFSQLHPADWHLSDNPFVQHSLNAFGYLLVGQLADCGRTVLCAPGIYHQQERYMANMFGFSRFIRCPGQKNCPPGFGYWCRLIQPANLHQGDRLS